MVAALRLADYRLVALALLVAVVWLIVRGLVWQALLQHKASYSQVFFTITEGYLLNNVLPFRLGEVARAYLLSNKAKMDFWQVLSTIIIERILDLAMAVGLLFGTLAFVVGGAWAKQAAIGVGIFVAAGLATLYLMARNQGGALRLLERLGRRWPFLLRISGRRLEAFFDGISVLTNPSVFVQAVFWMVLDWGLAVLQFYILLLAFFPNGQLLWAAFALGVAALGIAAPSSPGAVGVLELSLVGALAVFGLDSSTALAYALTDHLFNYVINGFLGAYALAKDGESLTGLYQRVRRLVQKKTP
jgi:uncharacterized protein (TIRG00374 family)